MGGFEKGQRDTARAIAESATQHKLFVEDLLRLSQQKEPIKFDETNPLKELVSTDIQDVFKRVVKANKIAEEMGNKSQSSTSAEYKNGVNSALGYSKEVATAVFGQDLGDKLGEAVRKLTEKFQQDYVDNSPHKRILMSGKMLKIRMIC
jgi:hypothetical protein